MKPICPSAFISDSGYHQFYRSKAVQCNSKCENNKLANGICDAQCNTPVCYHDGGDCDVINSECEFDDIGRDETLDSKSNDKKRSFYKASLDFNNLIFNKKFGPKNRQMVPHMPLIFNKNILEGT